MINTYWTKSFICLRGFNMIPRKHCAVRHLVSCAYCSYVRKKRVEWDLQAIVGFPIWIKES